MFQAMVELYVKMLILFRMGKRVAPHTYLEKENSKYVRVAQRQEAADLKSVQCGFESHSGYHLEVNMNHSPTCEEASFTYSGEGYNRVKICACGAETHDPE